MQGQAEVVETVHERPPADEPIVAIRHSEEIDKIAAAMVVAYAEMKPAIKDADNTHYRSKYADLGDVDDVVRPGLIKAKLFPMQTERIDRYLGHVVTTRVTHESGQWYETDVTYCEPVLTIDDHGMPKPPTSQKHGSSLTYARRYGYGAMFALTFTDAPMDDDGNDASGVGQKTGAGKKRATSNGKAKELGGGVLAIKAKFPSTCAICEQPIDQGADIAYHKERKAAAHIDCFEKRKAAKEHNLEDEPAPAEDESQELPPEGEDYETNHAEVEPEPEPEPEPAKKKASSRKKKAAAKKKTSTKAAEKEEPKPVAEEEGPAPAQKPDDDEKDDDLPF